MIEGVAWSLLYVVAGLLGAWLGHISPTGPTWRQIWQRLRALIGGEGG